jgi:site-specific DNA recombinase
MATIRRLRGRWQAMVRRRGVPPRCKSFDKRTDATRHRTLAKLTSSEAVDRRLLGLQREVTDCNERLRRLYRSIEDGIVELDDMLRERTVTLKSQRERAKTALDHARAQCGTVTTIDSAKIDAFACLMNEKLDTADTNARRNYIRSIIDTIEVDDNAIRIIGSKDVLQAVIAGKQTANGNVRGFVRKWRARDDSNVRTLPQELSRIFQSSNIQQYQGRCRWRAFGLLRPIGARSSAG